MRLGKAAGKNMEKKTMDNKLYARHGRATDALAAISDRSKIPDYLADSATFRHSGIEVTIINYSAIRARMGVNIHKLLSFAIVSFTSRYNKLQQESGAFEVSFPLDEYIQITGGTIPKDTRARRRKRNDRQKKIRNELQLLQSMQIAHKDQDSFESISPVCRTAAKNGRIAIEFSRPFAAYLLKQPKTTIHPQLLKISGRNHTAYAIGLKCTEQHYMRIWKQKKAGVQPATFDKLRVKNILRATDLPDYESILKAGRSWKDRIMRPFEKAMQELVDMGVLTKWKYSSPAAGADYRTFAESVVVYEVAEDPGKSRVINGGK